MATARLVAGAAEEAGVEPYLVGGAVRDALLGFAPTGDLDITLVGADTATFAQIARTVGGRISKSSQFNTARLEIGDRAVDLTMARAETYPNAGSLPVVRPGTLAEDLARRDFSVNAMAVSLTSDRWGKLFDPHGGREDLRDGRIRTLEEGSFRDDATRILRAARYAARLSFDLDDNTRQSLDRSVRFLASISPARIRNELERILLESSTGSTTPSDAGPMGRAVCHPQRARIRRRRVASVQPRGQWISHREQGDSRGSRYWEPGCVFRTPKASSRVWDSDR